MRHTIAPLVLALLLSGCNTTTTAETSTSTTTTPLPQATATTAADVTTTTITTTTTTIEATSVLRDCVVGDWELQTEEFLRSMYSSYGGSVAFELTVVGGSYVTTLSADGTFAASRNAWSWEATTLDGTLRTTIDGTESGTWMLDGEQMTVDVTSSDVTTRTSVIVDGEELDVPSPPTTVDTDVLGGTFTVICTGDVLTAVTTEGAISTFDRK